jgi:hypothetical protein
MPNQLLRELKDYLNLNKPSAILYLVLAFLFLAISFLKSNEQEYDDYYNDSWYYY